MAESSSTGRFTIVSVVEQSILSHNEALVHSFHSRTEDELEKKCKHQIGRTLSLVLTAGKGHIADRISIGRSIEEMRYITNIGGFSFVEKQWSTTSWSPRKTNSIPTEDLYQVEMRFGWKIFLHWNTSPFESINEERETHKDSSMINILNRRWKIKDNFLNGLELAIIFDDLSLHKKIFLNQVKCYRGWVSLFIFINMEEFNKMNTEEKEKW